MQKKEGTMPAETEKVHAGSSEEDDLQREEVESAKKYTESVAKYENSLALHAPSGVLGLLRVPGFVFFTGIAGYLLGRLGFGAWAVIPLLYVVGFVFLRRISEFKRSMEAFVYFAIRKQKKSKMESVDWMNDVLEKAWRYVEATASKILLLKIGGILRNKTFPVITDLRLEKFTLGGQPPVVEGIRIRRSSRDSLVIDAIFHFIPSEVEGKQRVVQVAGVDERECDWNSNITIAARLGGSTAGIDVPLTIKNVSFRGSVRIKINMTYEKNVVEGVEFCFLKLPAIGFHVVPLKIVDIMDIPGLSTAIRKGIELAIQKEALYPKTITVALRPKSLYYVGVIIVHLHRVVFESIEEYFVEVGVSGRKGKCTPLVSRSSPTTNFIAYLPVRNMDDTITLKIKKHPDAEAVLALGRVSIGEICMRARIQGILPLTGSSGYADISAGYMPKIDVGKVDDDARPKSAIATIKLLQLIDMVDAAGNPYKSLHARISVFLREKRKVKKDPASMSAVELMSAESLSPTATASATNDSSTDSDPEVVRKHKASQREHAPVAWTGDPHLVTDEVLGVFDTKAARGIVSPGFDDTFVLYTRDAKRTTVLVEVFDKSTALGSFTVNLKRGISMAQGTFDFQHIHSGRAKLLFGAEYAVMAKTRMHKYTHIRAVSIENMEHPGIYRGYIVTKGRVVAVEPFFSHGSSTCKAKVFVPVLSTEEESRFVAYVGNEVFGECTASTGDHRMGDETISISIEDIPLYETSDVSSKIGISTGPGMASAVFEEAPQVESPAQQAVLSRAAVESMPSPPPANKPKAPFIQCRIIVCRVDHPIYLEFSSGDTILDRTTPSSGKNLPGEFFFFQDPSVSVYTIKEGYLIGKFILPKTNGRHEIKLAHGQLFVIDVYNRWLNASVPMPLDRGVLQVELSRAAVSHLQGKEIFSSVFAEILLKDQVVTSKVSQNIDAPVFSDAVLKASVFRPVDEVTFRMFGWTHLDEKRFIGEYTLPLTCITPGTTSLLLPIHSLYLEDNEVYKAETTVTFTKEEAHA